MQSKKSSDQIKKTKVKIIDCGALSSLSWKGSVSAKKIIKEGLTTDKVLSQATRRLEEFYVKVDTSAKTRCIDGRHDPGLDESNLGPQVPGGAPGAAFAYRLGVDEDDSAKGTFLQDAEAMIDHYVRMGFAPGGHRDEQSLDDGRETVGCGAIDGMNKILSTMTESSLVNDHNRVVKLLLADHFSAEDYFRIMGAATVLNGRAEDYFRGRELIIDILERRDKDSIATLKGDHQEGLVAVNLVRNTTLSSNRFSKTFGGMQAFGYDLWWSIEIANRLMPRPEEFRKRQRFVMARVMTTVATLMALTDGTQRLVIRMADTGDDSSPEEPVNSNKS